MDLWRISGIMVAEDSEGSGKGEGEERWILSCF